MAAAGKRMSSRRARAKADAHLKKVNALIPDTPRYHLGLIIIGVLHFLLNLLLLITNEVLGKPDDSIDQERSRISVSTERKLVIVSFVFSLVACVSIVLMVVRYRRTRAQVLEDPDSRPLPEWMGHRDYRPSRRADAAMAGDGAGGKEPSRKRRASTSGSGSESEEEDDGRLADPLFLSMTRPMGDRSIFWMGANLFPGTGPNVADVCYLICIAFMAAGLLYPNFYSTPLNVLGCLLALCYMARPVMSHAPMLPTRPLPMGIAPIASAMDKLVTPAAVHISPTALVDIDRFLATADTRLRTFARAGLTVAQMSIGSFISIAVVVVGVGVAAFVVLQLQFVSQRASFYPADRLAAMAAVDKLTPYWPLAPTTATGAFEAGVAPPAAYSAAGMDTLAYDARAEADAAFGQHPRSGAFTPLAGGADAQPKLERLSSKRVVLVVLDGMRFDFLERNSEMRALLADNSFRKDAKVLKMKGQLPSMSVPNWITLVTGSPPEITGVLGNLNVPETPYDSIFSRAALFDPATDPDSFNATAASYTATLPFARGLTASPWFGNILRAHLPELDGVGTVDVSYAPPTLTRPIGTGMFASSDTVTADPADWRRASIAVQALSRVERAYQLFLAHFSDIDQQGHCCGVETKFNARDSYDGAVTNKTKIVRAMLEAVRSHPAAADTVVIITSDHGHLAPGGHGGVGAELLELPFILYSPDSGIGFAPPDSATGLHFPVLPHGERVDNPFEAQTQEFDNTFVAPTIAALLGVPVPRQALGLFVNDALPLMNQQRLPTTMRDLFEQKKALLYAFMAQSGADARSDIYDDPVLQPGYNSLQTSEGYAQGAARLVALYEKRREDIFNASLLRNFFIAIVTALALFLAGIFSLEYRSLVFLRSLAVYRYALCCCCFSREEDEEENKRTRRYSTQLTGQAKGAGLAEAAALGSARGVEERHDYSGAAKKRREAGVELSEFKYRQAAGTLRAPPTTGEKNLNEGAITGEDANRRRSLSVSSRRNVHDAVGQSNGTTTGVGATRLQRATSMSVMRPSVSYNVVPNQTRGSIMPGLMGSAGAFGGAGGAGSLAGPAPIVPQPLFIPAHMQGQHQQQTPPSSGRPSFSSKAPLPPPPQPPGGGGLPPSASGSAAYDYRGADLSRYGERGAPGGISHAGEQQQMPNVVLEAEQEAQQANLHRATVLGVRVVRKRKAAKRESVAGDGVHPPGWAQGMTGPGGVPIKPHAATLGGAGGGPVQVNIIHDDDDNTTLDTAPKPEPEPEQEPEREAEQEPAAAEESESSEEEAVGVSMPTQVSTYDPTARDWKRYHDELKESAMLNRRALLVAVGYAIIYIALSLGIFVLAYDQLGYAHIDSSVLHTDLVLPRYLELTVMVPCLIQFIIMRVLYARYVIWNPPCAANARVTDRVMRVVHNFGRFLFIEITSLRGLIEPAARGFLYLTTMYCLVILVLAALLLMVGQACFDYWIPTIYPVYFISPTLWVFRFRVLAVTLMLIPFMVLSAFMLLCLPTFHPYSDQYDAILRLFLYKERALLLRADPAPLNLDAQLEVFDRELDLLENLRMAKVTSARDAARLNVTVGKDGGQ